VQHQDDSKRRGQPGSKSRGYFCRFSTLSLSIAREPLRIFVMP
jgi:hypothetical protein